MLMLMTNIIQFAYNSCNRMRTGGHWNKFKPVYYIIISTPMVLLQPTCMLVIGSWLCDGTFSADQLTADAVLCDKPGNTTGCGFFHANGTFSQPSMIAIPGGTYYVDGCSSSMKNFFFDNSDNPNALWPNTVVGWMIQIFGTYLGFIIMFVGVCQATQLHRKVANKWRQLRGAN